MELIRVRDNGAGIEPDDLHRAFERHATSKLTSGQDLFRIRSLGFRGEALPSIAAVSKLECVTLGANGSAGKKLEIHGGEVVSEETVAADRGTDFIVRQLFFNTPARLKYMKTVQTELGHISDYVYRLALARPDISFIFRHNGKVLLQTNGRGDLQHAIAAIYGVGTAKDMIELVGETPDYRLAGWVSKPELTRASRSALTTIVNGRYIRNFSLIKAVLNGYHTLLPIHRFPLAVLHIEMDPALIDVNVHPSKLEVRFSKEKQLFSFIEATIKQKMNELVLIPKQMTSSLKNKPIQEHLDWSGSRKSERIVKNEPRGSKQPFHPPLMNAQDKESRYSSEKLQETVRRYVSAETKETVLPVFPELHLIGQMKGTYILAQNDDGLFLIDQHAAHERINYEFYYDHFGNPTPVSQELLIPMTLELTPADAELMRNRIELLEQVGVYLQPFGGNSYKVMSYPHWFPTGSERELIEEMIEWILTERQIDLAKLREKSAILCACKRSIKANESLSNDEINALFTNLRACLNPYTCPHGRPVVVSFSNHELEKMFKRVM